MPHTIGMLDARTAILLEAVNFQCKTGTYQVVEERELLEYFPEKFRIDRDGLKQMLAFLEEHEYIDVRYADDAVYCLCPLPQGRLYFERTREESKRETELLSRVLLFGGLISAAGGFLGALLAALVVL